MCSACGARALGILHSEPHEAAGPLSYANARTMCIACSMLHKQSNVFVVDCYAPDRADILAGSTSAHDPSGMASGVAKGLTATTGSTGVGGNAGMGAAVGSGVGSDGRLRRLPLIRFSICQQVTLGAGVCEVATGRPGPVNQ